jgi:hypothetical protein
MLRRRRDDETYEGLRLRARSYTEPEEKTAKGLFGVGQRWRPIALSGGFEDAENAH